ncbi:MAG: hypothetical protein Q4F85_08000 [Prevotella sp.]|nr:hypothetical protein [Prevotella sp.]
MKKVRHGTSVTKRAWQRWCYLGILIFTETNRYNISLLSTYYRYIQRKHQ